MSNELSIKSIVESQVGLVSIKGFVDAHTYEELQDEITEMMEDNPDLEHLVLDISAVDYMSSAGIGVVVNTQNEISERGGQLVLINPAPSVIEVFNTFGLTDMFAVHPSLEAAYSMLGKPPPSKTTDNRSASAGRGGMRPMPGLKRPPGATGSGPSGSSAPRRGFDF